MGRTLKGHDQRRNAILDGAWDLFTTVGYEKGTVAAILDRLGISKGTFYHYFSSKEAVLDAITDRLAEEPLARLRAVVDADLAAGPKLNRFVEVARQTRLRNAAGVVQVARVLYREENLLIRHKIADRLTAKTLPLLRAIIEQGVNEGAFRVKDAAEAAWLFWEMSSILTDQQIRTLLEDHPVKDKIRKLRSRADFVLESLERILEAKPGTFTRPSRQAFGLFVKAVDTDAAGSTY